MSVYIGRHNQGLGLPCIEIETNDSFACDLLIFGHDSFICGIHRCGHSWVSWKEEFLLVTHSEMRIASRHNSFRDVHQSQSRQNMTPSHVTHWYWDMTHSYVSFISVPHSPWDMTCWFITYWIWDITFYKNVGLVNMGHYVLYEWFSPTPVCPMFISVTNSPRDMTRLCITYWMSSIIYMNESDLWIWDITFYMNDSRRLSHVPYS